MSIARRLLVFSIATVFSVSQAAAVTTVTTPAAAFDPNKWKMPDKPDGADLDKYPVCNEKSVAGLRRCLTSLEYYRTVNLEEYRLSVVRYTNEVKAFDKRVEVSHGSGALNGDDYSQLHAGDVEALNEATDNNGRYMLPYHGRANELKADAQDINRQIDHCIATLDCPTS